MSLSNNYKGILAVSVGSALLGSIGIFVRFANSGIQPMTQTFGRIFVAFILILIYNLLRSEDKATLFNIQKKHVLFFLLNGLVGFSVMAVAFTLSVLYTSITNTYFLLYTAPIFAAILSAIFLKEKISKHIIVAIAMSTVGLVFLFNPSDLTTNLLGNLFGLATGLAFGSYFVITGYLSKFYKSPTITFWTQLVGALGIFPLIFIFDTAGTSPSMSDWLPIISAGVFVFFGYFLLNYGLQKISASFGSILSLFEPLSAIFYGLIFFSEIPTVSILLGASLIIISIAYLTKYQSN